MTLPAFKLLNFGDQLLQRFQQNISSVLQPLGVVAIINGQLATFTASADVPSPDTFVLHHNLGRVPVGIIPLVPPYVAFSTPGFGASFVQSNTPSQTPTTSTALLCTNEIRKGAVLSFWVF